MIGHNGGPTLEPGASWRKTCWGKARRDLMPTLPLQIVRLRVKRAKALGLDYKTYATVRATTGRDIIAFLFSDNALGIRDATAEPDPQRAKKLRDVPKSARHLAVHAPTSSTQLMERLSAHHGIALSTAFRAPTLSQTYSEIADHLQKALPKTPSDAIIVIGETVLERQWVTAARFAAFVPAERYFRQDI